MRDRLLPVLFLVCLVRSSGAQLAVDSDWAAYTSMLQINDVVVVGDDVWLATGGGALHYDRTTDSYRRFTRLDGLPGNRLLAVTADANGDLWFGSAGEGLSRLRAGATRFDTPFLEFRDRDILVLKAVGNRLYVGTDRGLSVFDLDKEEVKESYRRLGNFPKDAPVHAILTIDDVMYLGTSDGIAWAHLSQPNLQDPDSWRSKALLGDVFAFEIVDHLILAATKLGAYSFDPVTEELILEYNDEPVLSVAMFRGLVLAATSGGKFMQRISATRWGQIPASTILEVRRMAEAEDGTVWMATGEGIRVFGGAAPTPSGEPGSSRFYDMRLVDGDLWAASVPDDQQRSISAGVYQLDDGMWTVYNKRFGMPSDELVAVETDDEGRLWVGSWGQGIAIRSGDSWQRLNHTNSVLAGINGGSFVAISDVERDSDGIMWVVDVLVGVAAIDGYPARQSYMIPQQEAGLSNQVDLYHIAFSRAGHKWISSRTHGLVVLDDGGTPFVGGDDQMTIIDRNVDSRLSSNRAFDVLEDTDGTLWLGTDNGLNAIRATWDRSAGRLDVDSWRVYGSLDGLPSDEISALELDGEGHLWIGTSSGLCRIDDGEVAFTLTTDNSGLINNRITGLLFDETSNELWIGTFDGLSRLRLGTSPGDPDNPVDHEAIYPNPFVTDGRNELTFGGLPLGSSVQIYTLQGELVKHLAGEPGRGSLRWNGLNEAGFLVGSGIYFYVARSPSSSPIRGRFAVVDGSP